MFGITDVFVFFFLLQSVSAFDLKCSATKQRITFTVSNLASDIGTMKFYHKAPNPNDPWVEQRDCNLIEKQTLECGNARQNKGLNFRIDLQFTNGKNASKALWYFDCFENHGVRMISVQNATWNGFDVKWTHYTADENFVKEDEITISDDGKDVLQEDVDNLNNPQVFKYRKGAAETNYTVCVKTTFFRFATDTTGTEERKTPAKCTTIKTTIKPKDKNKGTDLKTPLLAVGIGILCLVLLCLLFVIYNKKCKQGGDHDYDMNKDDTLMGGEGAHGEGEELQVYKEPEANEKMLENGKPEEA